MQQLAASNYKKMINSTSAALQCTISNSAVKRMCSYYRDSWY